MMAHNIHPAREVCVAYQQLRAAYGMRVHDAFLFGGQPPWLIEYLIRNADFPDVMHPRSRSDEIEFRTYNTHLVQDAQRVFCHSARMPASV